MCAQRHFACLAARRLTRQLPVVQSQRLLGKEERRIAYQHHPRAWTQHLNHVDLHMKDMYCLFNMRQSVCVWHHPTMYGGFMQGVGVDFVVVISYKHSSVGMPVVPQHSCDGGGEVGQLEAGVCCLDWTHTHTFRLLLIHVCYFIISDFGK